MARFVTLESKFKVGDRVINVYGDSVNYGKKATVVGFHISTGSTFYRYDDGSYGKISLTSGWKMELLCDCRCKCNCCGK